MQGAPTHRGRSARGFTVLELMVVVGVMAVLAAMTAQFMSTYASGRRVMNASMDLLGTLHLARSEAVKRNELVKIAPFDATNWAKGWHVTAAAHALGQQDAYHGDIEFACIGDGCAGLRYDGSGRLAGSAATVQVSSPGTPAVRCITVDFTGRPRAAKAACPAQEQSQSPPHASGARNADEQPLDRAHSVNEH